VQAAKVEPRRLLHPAHRLEGVARGDREAELLVLVGGGDVLVGVRLDPGRHPHHDRGRRTQLRGDRGEPLDLLEGVDDDPTHALADGALEVGCGLVVAVVADPGRVEAGAQRDRQLARRAHVEAEPLLGDPARDRRAQERLAGVVHVVVAERLLERAGARTEVRLVEDVGRRAVLGDEVAKVHPAHLQGARVVLARRAGPQQRHERIDVRRLTQP
jgi:hypothetical protein